ncbi:MAG: hypothetical protein JKX76_02400 [Colwellia sp.]|nr:hypothetical protein [Colwellia sp.]
MSKIKNIHMRSANKTNGSCGTGLPTNGSCGTGLPTNGSCGTNHKGNTLIPIMNGHLGEISMRAPSNIKYSYSRGKRVSKKFSLWNLNKFNIIYSEQNIILNSEFDTPLLIACVKKDTETALKIINLGKLPKAREDGTMWISRPSHIICNKYYNQSLKERMPKCNKITFGPFTDACSKKTVPLLFDITDADNNSIMRITSLYGEQSPFQKQKYSTLMIACIYKLPEVALKILETKESNPWFLDHNDNSALMIACNYSLSTVALKILDMYYTPASFRNNQICFDHINNEGDTILTIACKNALVDVVKKIIQLSSLISKLNHINFLNMINNNGNTALLLTCMFYQKIIHKIPVIRSATMTEDDFLGGEMIPCNSKSSVFVTQMSKTPVGTSRKISVLRIPDPSRECFSTCTRSLIDFSKFDRIASLLVQNSADVHILNKNGKSAIKFAKQKNMSILNPVEF